MRLEARQRSDEETNNRVFDTLDKLNELKRYTTDSLKIFCRIKLLEGKIYQEILDMEDSARRCFK